MKQCLASREGYTCTLEEDHIGRHEAGADEGFSLVFWWDIYPHIYKQILGIQYGNGLLSAGVVLPDNKCYLIASQYDHNKMMVERVMIMPTRQMEILAGCVNMTVWYMNTMDLRK